MSSKLHTKTASMFSGVGGACVQTLPGVQISSMSSQQSPYSRHDGSQRQKVGGAKHNPCTSRSQHSAKPASTHDPARVDAGTGAEKMQDSTPSRLRPVQKGSPDRLSSSRRLSRKSALSISTRHNARRRSRYRVSISTCVGCKL